MAAFPHLLNPLPPAASRQFHQELQLPRVAHSQHNTRAGYTSALPTLSTTGSCGQGGVVVWAAGWGHSLPHLQVGKTTLLSLGFLRLSQRQVVGFGSLAPFRSGWHPQLWDLILTKRYISIWHIISALDLIGKWEANAFFVFFLIDMEEWRFFCSI